MLNLTSQLRESASRSSAAPSPVLAGDIVLSEHAVGLLRRYLREAGLGEWRIFQGHMRYLATIDEVLDKLDPNAVWESAGPSLAGEEPIVAIVFEDEPTPSARAWQSGMLHLREMQVVVARWYWYDPANYRTRCIRLTAAPQIECVETLRQRLLTLNRTPDEPVWQIAGEYGDDATVPRGTPESHALHLGEALRKRVEAEIIGFFSPPVRRMYERLNVPYRRGVLMYGEPGNGKTSLIRWIGACLPDVAAITLRAKTDFSTDTLIETFDLWKELAPAILVIEDLTAVLERVNLATLLNLLDGVDRKSGNGLMLIASTNHPQKLDAALSNRPGRFDVVIELPAPDETQRQDFLRAKLLEIDLPTLHAAAEAAKGVSYAHLEEIVRLSGMIALRDGREFRMPADVNAAVDHVRQAFNAAAYGYAKMPEVPFGLAGFRGEKR